MTVARVSAIVLFLAAVSGLAWAVTDRTRSIAEIDKTLTSVNSELTQSEEEFVKYEPSLVQALIGARIGVLKLTVSMLEQKRASFIHRIDLRYTVDGKAFTPDPPEVITALEKEIEDAQAKIRKAEEDSAQYTGGLVKVMIELQRATINNQLAMLQMRLAAARFGMPLLGALPKDGGKSEGQKLDPGTVRPDEDTL